VDASEYHRRSELVSRGNVPPRQPAGETGENLTEDNPSGPGAALRTARRIALVGCIGAGKSTLARTLGEMLGLEVFHLDRLWWQGGGYRITGPETVAAHTLDGRAFRQLQQELASGDDWIIDGGRADLDVRLSRADTVIFLDLPRRTCMWRLIKRTGRSRADYPPDVRESLRWLVLLLRWVWTYPQKRPGMLRAIETYGSNARLIHCRSKADVQRLLETLR
jgi:adenylate kinase family enzyme